MYENRGNLGIAILKRPQTVNYTMRCLNARPDSDCRHHIPVWRAIRGGGVGEPERHQLRGHEEAVGADVQLRARAAGVCAARVGRQAGERARRTAGAAQEGQGKILYRVRSREIHVKET